MLNASQETLAKSVMVLGSARVDTHDHCRVYSELAAKSRCRALFPSTN